MPDWDPRANEIFLNALDLPATEERETYLAGACGGDAALRAHVESLLAAITRAGNFLEEPALPPTADRAPRAGHVPGIGRPGDPAGAGERPRVSLVLGSEPDPTRDVRTLLHRRLRFVALGFSVLFGYFALLTLINPFQKVGLFLEHPPLVVLNWLVLGASTALTVLLWQRRSLALDRLRAAEVGLFGLALLEMGTGYFFDLFVDHELLEPLGEGDHKLFHYASSWSLPFFALIVAYGTLVPSSWRRCMTVVGAMALLFLGLSVVGGLCEAALSQTFLRSYVLQAALWMVSGVGIAVYGAHRLEALRREAVDAGQLGQYRLRRPIGTGGMGEVYLAEHALLRRPCAIKVIRPDRARDEHALRRFEQEVQAIATLTHPNTVQVFDYGRTGDGTFYYVMEYLPGLNLEQLVREQGPLPPARVVRVLRQVCGALREAHAIGLVHRDIKPGNIILCERGGVADVAKLLDFGVVHPLDLDPAAGPVPGRLVAGTPSYMSPEQARGGSVVDARTDIYSLGATAYFLLTGRPPFVKPSGVELLRAHGQEAVVPPRRLRPDVPAGLEEVVLRCLEKDPARRFASAQALDQALAACDGPVSADGRQGAEASCCGQCPAVGGTALPSRPGPRDGSG